MGRDARVLDVLEDASRRVDTGLQGQPAVEAAVRDTLSEAFYYLGQYDRAEQQAVMAARIHEQMSSRDGPATLKSLDNVARALIGKGKYPESETIVREVLDRRTRSLGLRTPETLRSMGTLTAALLGAERNAEAEAVCRQMLEAAEGVLPPGNDTRLDLLNDLGLALRRQNKLEEAETVLRKAVDESARLRGETHPDTLASMTNLANVLSAARKFSEAEAVGRKTLEIKTRGGPAHAGTVVAQSASAILCRQKPRASRSPQPDRRGQATHLPRAAPLATITTAWVVPGRMGRYRSGKPCSGYEAGGAGPLHVYTQLTVAHAVRLYQNWKRPVQAAAWQAKSRRTPLTLGESSGGGRGGRCLFPPAGRARRR